VAYTHEMANLPRKVSVGGRELFARMLPFKAALAACEQRVLDRLREKIRAFASGLSGAERVDYMATATLALPEGRELFKRVRDFVQTAEGAGLLLHMALRVEQPDMTEADCVQLALAAEDEVVELVTVLLGIKPEPRGKKKAERKARASKKRTAKRSKK